MRPLRIGLVLTFLLIGVSRPSAVQAQSPADSAYVRSAYPPGHWLKPITQARGSTVLGSMYYYGGKRLTQNNALEVPFYELNDPVVNHHYRVNRTFLTIGRIVTVAPLAYILLIPNRQSVSILRKDYWTIVWLTAGVSVGLNIAANVHVRKAVEQYNHRLRELRVGMVLTPAMPTGNACLGIGGRMTF